MSFADGNYWLLFNQRAAAVAALMHMNAIEQGALFKAVHAFHPPIDIESSQLFRSVAFAQMIPKKVNLFPEVQSPSSAVPFTAQLPLPQKTENQFFSFL